MIPSKQSKNELRTFLDRKNLTPQIIAEQMHVPPESIQALYNNPRLLPNIDLIALFMHVFPGEDPTQMLAYDPTDPEAPITTMLPNTPDDPLQITICGCGNLGHVFAGLFGNRDDIHLNILVSTEEKAAQLNKTMMQTGVTVHTPTDTVMGKPNLITADPSKAIPNAQLILLCVPSHIETQTLNRILPHITHTPYIGTIPAPGGFDWKARHLLKQHNKSATIFGLGYIPHMCKIAQYGQTVHVLGSKLINALVTMPSERTPEVCDIMSHLLQTPVIDLHYFLNMTLHPGNQLLHPGIMYDLFKDWNGTPLPEQPLFYESASTSAAELLQTMSDELITLKGALENQIPNLHLPFVFPLHQAIIYGYGEAIQNPATLHTTITTNRAYAGLRTPMIQQNDGWIPDWNSRFFHEDIPHGLVVLRGIADLLNISLPTIDTLLNWAQTKMNCEYLIHGQLTGKDIANSGAPSCYHIQTLQDLIA